MICLGPALWESVEVPVLANDRWQMVTVPENCPLAQYLQLELIGKRQRQREDLLHYVCLRRVLVFGHSFTPAQVVAVSRQVARSPKHRGGVTLRTCMEQFGMSQAPLGDEEQPEGGTVENVE